ncbi:MAG: glycosyltransferase family 2 protein [Candidatus Eiseniibacteriota bacterium]
MPRISVVVSHYDRPALLAQALESIAVQTRRDFEVIVVNDHGADSAPLVEAFAGRIAPIPVRYDYRPSNEGVAATRNRGLALARGDFIAYLDDDDLWRPGHLERLAGALEAEPACALAYGDAEVLRLVREPGVAWRVADRRTLAVPFDLDDLKRDDFIVPGGMVHRRALYDRVGPYDTSLGVSDDWDWLLRVAATEGAGAFVRVPEIVITVRIFGEGINLSATSNVARRAALDTIERRHGTPHLEPKTFWEVAGTYLARAELSRGRERAPGPAPPAAPRVRDSGDDRA